MVDSLQSSYSAISEASVDPRTHRIASIPGDGIGVEVGRAYETVVLVPSDQGWRIRHVHRSLNRNGPRGSR
jgi:hypothetical protein